MTATQFTIPSTYTDAIASGIAAATKPKNQTEGWYKAHITGAQSTTSKNGSPMLVLTLKLLQDASDPGSSMKRDFKVWIVKPDENIAEASRPFLWKKAVESIHALGLDDVPALPKRAGNVFSFQGTDILQEDVEQFTKMANEAAVLKFEELLAGGSESLIGLFINAEYKVQRNEDGTVKMRGGFREDGINSMRAELPRNATFVDPSNVYS